MLEWSTSSSYLVSNPPLSLRHRFSPFRPRQRGASPVPRKRRVQVPRMARNAARAIRELRSYLGLRMNVGNPFWVWRAVSGRRRFDSFTQVFPLPLVGAHAVSIFTFFFLASLPSTLVEAPRFLRRWSKSRIPGRLPGDPGASPGRRSDRMLRGGYIPDWPVLGRVEVRPLIVTNASANVSLSTPFVDRPRCVLWIDTGPHKPA